jgi:hypothetical protein
MCRLRFFEICVNLRPVTMYDFQVLSFMMGSLRISLTSPATLEHLKIDISVNSDCIDEEWRFYENLGGADAWSYLDSITSHPTGSRLQRVDIIIDCFSSWHSDNEDFDAGESVLESLPLLHSKGILFVKVE